MTSVDSNFNYLCGRPHGAGSPPPSTCVHLSLTPSPLRVDVINGWPPTVCYLLRSDGGVNLHKYLDCPLDFRSDHLFGDGHLSTIYVIVHNVVSKIVFSPLFCKRIKQRK